MEARSSCSAVSSCSDGAAARQRRRAPLRAAWLLAGLLIWTGVLSQGRIADARGEAEDAHGREITLSGAGPDVQPPLAKRPLPRYSGRSAGGVEPGEVLIWIPRVIFYPIHRVLNMTLRYPAERLATWVEQHRLQNWIRALFLWDQERVGLFPTFYWEFGLDPSVGFFFYYNDLLAPRHRLTMHGGFWSSDWISLMQKNRLHLFSEGQGVIEIRAFYLRRPDMPFNGIGAGTTQDDETFYRVSRAGLELRFWSVLSGHNRFFLKASFRRLDFAEGRSPSIASRWPLSGPGAPPGFEGYQLLSGMMGLDLDSRNPRGALLPGSGLRLELFASGHVDPAEAQRNFVRWGGEAAGFWDVSGVNHVLGLRAYLAFAEQTGSAPIPFEELVILGGKERMRGFYEGRFRGRSGLVLTADYRYPIWAFLDANLFFSLGNTFNEHLEGISPKKLFGSWGVSARSNNRRDHSFEVLLGFGSSRFDAPSFALAEVRFSVGVNHGF